MVNTKVENEANDQPDSGHKAPKEAPSSSVSKGLLADASPSHVAMTPLRRDSALFDTRRGKWMTDDVTGTTRDVEQ